jgi:hypothetical protein
MNKEFSKEDYMRYDSKAKFEGMKLCLDSGRYLMEERGVNFDFVMQRINKDQSLTDMAFEVTVKEVWDTMGIWPVNWQTIHMKASRIISQADYYMVFNRGMDTAWIIPMVDAKKAPLVNIKNKKNPEGESFYDIPIEWGKFWFKPIGSEKWGPLNS